MNLKNGFQMIKTAASDFLDDKAMTLAASLAFYSALSLAPLLVILISVASLLGSDLQGRVVAEIETAIGPEAGEAVHEIIQSGEQQQQTGTLATIAGFAVLLFSATGVFAQMQDSLNAIWEVQAKPGRGLWRWLRKRILSLSILLGIGFLLLIPLGAPPAH
jgi:membrane protein